MIKTNPDILITDFHALSAMSPDTLFKHKIGILLLWTGCLPGLEDENLLGFISQGVIGILSTEASPSELRKAIKSVAAGELWFNRKKLKDILSCVKNVAEEIHELTKKKREK
ncbi:MAG: DNA-binding response regulator [Candidatus Brocadia sp. AMX2]|uniref:Response regulatory domain-containing protein n=1 Tax=Candidatus Brocadia sinica JPN1 TaxID=1197129 RepID=A0ABQ0JUY0_9BACT|nr:MULTISPECIES: response regulator transcription factor [Brocadia]MBC6930873.1 DNA-binding response regulator [Candidatus Brocadia sp.]MBL1167864.1 DNA-binding response regulator [Candidatus Brocadia sp. AMX1]MCK6469125.1 response regulator transcription factor [Candidatus Brocadia sinica]NOG41569.1 response regulator transcription factor [Planctomycetota bacterium]KAA0245413.1 MAG: DNA-binding response regulator [Candidatus Brocadia sp. AMX2]